MRRGWISSAVAVAALAAIASIGTVGAKPADLGADLTAQQHGTESGVTAPESEIREAIPPFGRDQLRHIEQTMRSVPAYKPTGGTRMAGPDAPYEFVVDNFNTAILDPAKWILIFDRNGSDFGWYEWGLSDCQYSDRYDDTLSLWSLAVSRDPEDETRRVRSDLGCDDPYPPGVNSAALLRLDLTGFMTDTAQLDLETDFWLNVRTFAEGGVVPDGLFVLGYPDPTDLEGESIVLANLTARRPDRFWEQPIRIDLLNGCSVYDPSECHNFAGQVAVVEFFFISRRGADATGYPGGVYIDNVRLLASDEPSVDPGPPTASPTASHTPEATATLVPTETSVATPTSAISTTPTVDVPTATPTREKPAGIYLPIALRNSDLQDGGGGGGGATEETPPSPEETPTPPEETPMPSMEPSPTATMPSPFL